MHENLVANLSNVRWGPLGADLKWLRASSERLPTDLLAPGISVNRFNWPPPHVPASINVQCNHELAEGHPGRDRARLIIRTPWCVVRMRAFRIRVISLFNLHGTTTSTVTIVSLAPAGKAYSWVYFPFCPTAVGSLLSAGYYFIWFTKSESTTGSVRSRGPLDLDGSSSGTPRLGSATRVMPGLKRFATNMVC
jgi:hypothetical protein